MVLFGFPADIANAAYIISGPTAYAANPKSPCITSNSAFHPILPGMIVNSVKTTPSASIITEQM